MSKAGKKKDSTNRITSGAIKGEIAQATQQVLAASLVGSVASADSRAKSKVYPVWPEFNENDLAAEKWDAASKGKEKGKSPSLTSFDDPEGRIELPSSLKVHEWKRPVDFLEGKTPVIVNENEGNFDLLKPNEHLCHSELMRCIIGQISSLWNIFGRKSKPSPTLSARNSSATPEPGEDNLWRPWEHIYAMTKPAKGPNVPQYNHYGKYVVKIFWMGCWRKIVVDDYMPFGADGRLLLPAVRQEYKLWPMLLSKALIKVASIDYNTNDVGSQLGDFFVIQCLTGWLPETIPLEYGHIHKVWDFLKDILPEWRRPEEKPKEAAVEFDDAAAPALSKKDRLESGVGKGESGAVASHKGSKGSKDGGKKKDDRDKKSMAEPESLEKAEKRPETVVFATFSLPEESPARVSVLKEMADASEQLRKVGLSHLHPHPVLLTKTRNKPLEPPPPPPVIPPWKLIRPKKKRTTPTDEPIPEPEPPKPDQWLEITSAFVNHRISPLPLDPNYIKARTSPLGIKGSRPSTGATLKGIIEDTEVKVELPKEDGVFQAQHIMSSKRKPSMKGPSASRLRERKDSSHGSPSLQSHISSSKEREPEYESLQNQADLTEGDGRESATNELQHDDVKESKTDERSTESVSKTTWMDFEDFCRTFQTLIIFHKPATYACHHQAIEIKHSLITGTSSGAPSSKKGSAIGNHSGSTSNVRGSAILKEEERTSNFLFIDNVHPSDLVVSFSVLPRWSGSESERDKKISDKESVTGASEVVSIKEPAGSSTVPTGLLVAEPYSWKSLVGKPILRIRTTGTRAACLTLPAGRHVLRFFFDTPLGYSLSICSTVNFVYGEEETVMKPLVGESCRFIQTATSIMQGIGKCIESLGDVEAWSKARKELQQAHMPYKVYDKKELAKHYEVWHKAFYETMTKLMADSKVASLGFALRSFNLDLSPQSAEFLAEPRDPIEARESWVTQSPNADQLKAIRNIQRCWRGAVARKMRRAVTQKDTSEHLTMKDALNYAWQLIQPNMEATGLKLLRSMLKKDPRLIERYPFHKDEWNKISYADYTGTYEDQPPNTWFVMFRETFMVEEDMLCVPKLYSSVRTSMLRVINNDTGKEIKRVFQKVAPHVYRKNKRGYTFMCEARSLDVQLQGGAWSLRLIGSSSLLPQPISGQVNHHFRVKENSGFYIPNEKNIILRYHVKTKLDLIGTVQMQTSKPDVYIKLQILDREKEVASAQGKGHCVIPAVSFLTDEKSEERSSSRLSQQESRTLANQSSKQGVPSKKRGSSAKSKDGKASPKPGSKDLPDRKASTTKLDSPRVTPEDSSAEPVIPHKYTIQAIVERNSWPLTESQWMLVRKLKEQEKEEIKIYSGDQESEKPNSLKQQDRPSSPGASRTAGSGGKAAPDKGKKKGGKEKKTQDKESGSRPPSQRIIDISKPFWVLDVVVDEEKGDDVDVKKDTDRQEEIKAKKRAWEAQQPGRAVKALQARLAYLEKSTKKVEKDSDKENEDESAKSEVVSDAGATETREENLTLQPPRPPTPKVILEPLDLTPFYRPKCCEGVETQYLDESILTEKERMEAEVADQYERKRQEVLEWREKERNDRLEMKISQIRTFQEMQNNHYDARAELRKPREAYRQALLEEERKSKEEEEEKAALAAAADAGSRNASPKGKKSAGKKKK